MLLLKKDFIRNISFVFLTDFITKILAFAILPIYLFLMPKDEFGEFGFIFTIAITTSTLLSLSFYTILIKDLSKIIDYKIHQDFFSTLFITTILFNILLVFIFIVIENKSNLFSNFFELSYLKSEKLFLICLIIIFNITSLFQYSLLLVRKKTLDICIFIFLKFFIANVLGVIFLFYGHQYLDSVTLRLLGIVISELILIFIIFVIIKRNYFILKINIEYFIKSLKIAYPLIASVLLSLIMVTIDRKLIQYYHGNLDLADYNLSYLLLLPVAMIVSSIQSIWSPRLFEIKDDYLAKEETKKAILTLFIFLLILSGSIYAVVSVLFHFNLIASEYRNVLPLFISLSLGTILGSLLNFIDNLNLYINRTYYKLITTFFIVFVFSVLNIYLVPIYSYYGVSISLFVSNLLGLILGYSLIIRYLKISNKKINS